MTVSMFAPVHDYGPTARALASVSYARACAARPRRGGAVL